MKAILLILSLILGNQMVKSFDSWLECEDENSEDCQVAVCPNCRLVDCFPMLEENDCPQGTHLVENLTAGGCCPACVKYLLAENETCILDDTKGVEDILSSLQPIQCTKRFANGKMLWGSRNSTYVKSGSVWIPVIDLLECHAHYPCSNDSMTCTSRAESDCVSQKSIFDEWQTDAVSSGGRCTEIRFDVSCDLDTGYDPAQTHANVFISSPLSTCADFYGNPIFGTPLHWNDGLPQCECSRKMWELMTIPLRNLNGKEAWTRDAISMHCHASGDYDRLQCDGGRCWCADERTGRAVTNVVVETLARLLPCFSSTQKYGLYERKCDSKRIGLARARNKFLIHGHQWATTDAKYETRCDMDGSFYRKQCSESKITCQCVNPSNQQIENYGVFQDLDDWFPIMDCSCARDSYDGKSDLECVPSTGNYRELQQYLSSGFEFCVDENGQFKSSKYPLPPPDATGKLCEIEGCLERESVCQSSNDTCVKCQGYCTTPPH